MGARELLAVLIDAGLSVAAEGGRLVIRPGSKLPDGLRDELRKTKPELLALLRGIADLCQPGQAAAGYSSADSAQQRCVARLLRLHWPRPDAEAFAERLAERDSSGDERVSCFECRHYRPGTCGNYRRAGLPTQAVGPDLAALLQRCSGFSPQ